MGAFTPRYSKDISSTRNLMRGPEMQALMKHIAESEGVPFAESISPHESGEYRGNFSVTTGVSGHGDRAEARIVNSTEYAPQVERKHRVLARTADHLERPGG